jgi:hypothetical protein
MLIAAIVQQVRIADRVISLTDTGGIRQRDSLLLLPNPKDDSDNSEDDSGDDDQDAILRDRPLSTLEVVQGITVGSLPEGSSSKDKGECPPTASAGVYRYYMGIAGRRKLLAFVGMCMIFVAGISFNR